MEGYTKEIPNSLMNEHLIEGVQPIFVCLGKKEDFKEEDEVTARKSTPVTNFHYVNFYGNKLELKEKGMLQDEDSSYVISGVDNVDKYADGFMDCTGLVVVGIDKETGENVSFITHQDPKSFLAATRDDFVTDLDKRLTEVVVRCKEGTIDAVIIGGNYDHVASEEPTDRNKRYIDSIKLLTEEVKAVFRFEPVVVNGPKIESGEDIIYFHNQKRRLYLIRPNIIKSAGSFNWSLINAEDDAGEERAA